MFGLTRKSIFCLGISIFLLAQLAIPLYVAAEGLEEVIVTAQKREESLQEVPISIATVSKERLDSMLDSGADIRVLAGRVPSLNVDGSSGRTAPRFYIRGLGNTDFDLQASQPVSIVMDDVVMENVLLKGFPLFDVKQVEVLRGPQGTLFGRNTPAGIIKFDTNKPTQELEGYVNASYARYDSPQLRAAVGGGLTNTLSGRVAMQYVARDDWVKNAFTGYDTGGHRDAAFRTHLLFEPSDNFSALLTLQYRDLDATTTLFRANILSKGSNKLNNRFDRDVIYHDGARNSPSHVNTFGNIFKMEYNLNNGLTLTSITGYLAGDSDGMSDVDGAAGIGNTPCCGFIPFPVAAGNIDTDLDQITQEIRLSNSGDEAVRWQLGLFYFTDTFDYIGANFNGIGNPNPPTKLKLSTQKTDAFAIFGQLSKDVTDQLTLTAGLRFSSDEKSLVYHEEEGGASTATFSKEMDDTHLSWDISANYALNDEVTLYSRFANGYRGPSLQSKAPKALGFITTADSETVNSFEAGVKSEFWNNRIRLNGALFYYEVSDQQFTAIGGGGNFNRLVNADKGVGQGFELDADIIATDRLSFYAGLSYNDTEIKDPNLFVRTCGGGCTTLDATKVVGGKTLASVNGNPFPLAPEWIFSGTARYAIPVGNGELYAFTDWTVTGYTNLFLYESEEFNHSGNFEGGLRVGYDNFKTNMGVAAFVRNLTDEENLVGGVDFNNLTGFVNEPRIFGVEAHMDF